MSETLELETSRHLPHPTICLIHPPCFFHEALKSVSVLWSLLFLWHCSFVTISILDVAQTFIWGWSLKLSIGEGDSRSAPSNVFFPLGSITICSTVGYCGNMRKIYTIYPVITLSCAFKMSTWFFFLWGDFLCVNSNGRRVQWLFSSWPVRLAGLKRWAAMKR